MSTGRLLLPVIAVAVLLAPAARPADGPVVATMDELRFAAPKDKGAAELVDGKVGDLLPVLPGPRAKPLGPGGNPPSKVSAVWVGKWWYWGDYPAHAFTLDELRLEPTVDRPAVPRPAGAPLARVRERLAAGQPVTVVTMGDSLTDVRHHANCTTNWPTLLAGRLKARFESEVTVVNPAIGGTQLRQNLVLVPRWRDAATGRVRGRPTQAPSPQPSPRRAGRGGRIRTHRGGRQCIM